MAIDRSPDLNYGLRYDRFDVSFDDEEQISPRANLVWKIDDATSPTSAMRAISCRPRCNTFRCQPSRHSNTPPTLLSMRRTIPKKSNAITTLTWAFTATHPRMADHRGHVLQAGQEPARRRPVRQRGHTQQFQLHVRHGLRRGVGQHLQTRFRCPLYANFSYVQTWARNIDSVENEFPTNELAYIASNPIQLDHQGRYTGSGGVAYTFLKDTQLYSDFLYGNGLRAGFANLEKLPAYWTDNVGVEHVWHLHSKGISELKLRFDCINLFDAACEIRNGTGVGIAAPAYGPRRGLYSGLSVVF
jgi:hypothetical protein